MKISLSLLTLAISLMISSCNSCGNPKNDNIKTDEKTNDCSCPVENNCGCCGECDREDIEKKIEQCGCCTDCGTGPNA